MRVIRAEVMGMCFGVRDALKAIEGISDPRGVTILGQLVHNEVVLGELKVRGFAMRHEPTGDRSGELVPGSGRVLIAAAGAGGRRCRRGKPELEQHASTRRSLPAAGPPRGARAVPVRPRSRLGSKGSPPLT